MKKTLISLIGVLALLLGASTATAMHHEADETTPSTVIHVVTVSWKADATEEQINAALEGVKTIAKEFDGVSRVWVRTIKAQGERTHAFVMEFKSEAALKEYAGSAAQKKWYEVYIPIRERSTTFDISN